MVKQITGAVQSVGIEWKDYLKKLMVVEPLELEKDIKTVHGNSDAVRANVYVVLSADGTKYEAFEDILIFPRVLQSQTRRKIGSLVCGRLTQGEAKKGQDPPWVLSEPSEKDLKAAAGLVSALNTVSASPTDDGGDDDFDDNDVADVPADEEGEF